MLIPAILLAGWNLIVLPLPAKTMTTTQLLSTVATNTVIGSSKKIDGSSKKSEGVVAKIKDISNKFFEWFQQKNGLKQN